MYKFPILDFDQLNNEMNSLKIPAYKKLPYIYENMGGTFYDKEKRLLKGCTVAITGIGGLPIGIKGNEYQILNNDVSLEDIKNNLGKTLGMSAGMSYLNPYNKTLNDLADKTLSLGHNSIKHSIFLNILLVGLSIGVEHEFSTQRDIIHLSRLTVAKTSAQKHPCLVVNNEKQVELYKNILDFTDKQIESYNDEEKDWETLNLLYPTAKASMIMISGSLRNIEKLVSLKDSDGKEDEFIDILNKIENVISRLK